MKTRNHVHAIRSGAASIPARFPYAASIRVSFSNLPEHSIKGRCLEVCRNGLRIETLQFIPAPAEVILKSPGLGLSGKGIVRYCRGQDGKYIVGLEFAAGLRWYPPEQAAETALSAGMTKRTAAIFQELMGGSSARELQPSIDRLSDDEQDILFCTAASIQSAVAETCRARAEEIAGLLTINSQRLPASLMPV
ncbi:MAG TPA: hypothetical protein VGV35_09830 [Bryobacteraceae bacterium]|nr:hypothetical protein [Bryobacteraceae bacterium]